MEKCSICENEEINKQDNFCKICGHKLKKQRIVEFIKDENGITVQLLSEDINIPEILGGIGLLIIMIMQNSKKSKKAVLEDISMTLDILSQKKEKEGETENE